MIGIVSSNRPSSKILRRPRKGAPVDVAGGWNALRVDFMRWMLRMKREANSTKIDAVLAATGARPIVEILTRDPWWGARPVADRYEGRNVLGRLWMELHQQLRDHDPAARSGGWLDRTRVSRLAGLTDVPGAAQEAA